MGLFGFGKSKDELLEAKIQKLEKTFEKKKQKIEKELEEKRSELKHLKYQIEAMNEEVSIQEYGFFERQYKFSDSAEYKKKLDTIRNDEKVLVKDGRAGVIIQPMMLNNSESKGRAMQNQLIKAAIRGFNGEVDAALVKVTPSNFTKKKMLLFVHLIK